MGFQHACGLPRGPGGRSPEQEGRECRCVCRRCRRPVVAHGSGNRHINRRHRDSANTVCQGNDAEPNTPNLARAAASRRVLPVAAPEDHRVEGFASHVREQAKQSLGGELARIEKFTTSIRDGIDLRETLRHWKNPSAGSPPEIYVRDIPPSRGKVEVVVFLFEVPADPAKFSWQTTWYAEHAEESTLSFFATPFLENMVGPGIGQAVYGGALFLFPPRPIPNIWEDPRLDFTHSLEERLLAGAFAHSQFPHVVVVSPRPPLAKWRQLAKRYHRHLLPIPLSRFSGQTVSRLRQFHVLNGHEIRSYATKFIRE